MPAGAITLNDIQAADWSLMLDSAAPGGAAGAGIGGVVQGLDDVAQCIAIILTTPKGSDPFRPDFACDAWQFIDMPINRATAHIVREVTEAITKWEPRVKLVSVTVSPVIDGSAQSGAHLNVSVTWQLKLGGAAPQTTTVRL